MKIDQSWLASIQQILYPATCLLCGQRGLGDLDLCGHCIENLPWLCESRWHCLNVSSLQASEDCPCLREERESPTVLHSLFRYEGGIRHLLQRMKFGHDPVPCRTLGILWAKARQHTPKPDLLVPVPLHPFRQAGRGFNQSQLLAAALGAELGLQMDTLIVQRTRSTRAMSTLDRQERHHNLESAFELKKSGPWKHIAVIDDVYTTGTTSRTVSHLLAPLSERVSIWTLARA